MRISLVVIPLTGDPPFLIEHRKFELLTEEAVQFGNSSEHWVIDPSDNTYLGTDEDGDLAWFEMSTLEEVKKELAATDVGG